eukprot:54089_1
MISNQSDGSINSEVLNDTMSSRNKQHRIHYSRIKSAAIAASYRLMHVSTDNVLVRKTANAAVNGMRPEIVKTAQEHKQQVEPDIIDDEMYNHKPDLEAITDLCLVKEPRRNRDILNLKPPQGFEFVLLSTLSQETKPKPILCGSGEKYYLCFRRRTHKHECAITDIQITFKSTIPLGYEPLNYLHDGTELPYFQRKEETEQKQQNEQKLQNDNNPQQSNSNAKASNSTSNQLQKPQPNSNSKANNVSNENKKALQNDGSAHAKPQSASDSSSSLQNNNIENKAQNTLSFDNIPLIIFSKTGKSNVIDIQLKELGAKLREGLIYIDRSMDDHVANLNKGSADTNVHPIYLSYANELIAYRFSAKDLEQHINLKFLTPLLISLHLRKAELAITAIDSLKYLLLSNFIRFRDHQIMLIALNKICAAVSHSVVTWNTAYHDKLMDTQIIIFQKFIHHLPATCLWSMLVSSLVPLKYDLPKKFLKKYIETSFSYIRILEFGDSLDDTGNIKTKKKDSLWAGDEQSTYTTHDPTIHHSNHHSTPYQPPMAFGMNGTTKSRVTPGGDQYTPDTMHNHHPNPNEIVYEEESKEPDLFSSMKQFVCGVVDKAVNHSIASRSLVKFYKTEIFSAAATELIGDCCRALFITDQDKAWKPLGTMIIFLCRMALTPYGDIRDKKRRLIDRSCRHCTRLLEKIIDTACNEEYVIRMPSSFKYLLRLTVSRTICYNLCNRRYERYEDIFNANLRFFEKICVCWYGFFQHEIGVILTQVILPQALERFTPFRRRQKFLSCISRILLKEKTLIELVYSLDIIYGTRCIHGIVDSLMGILVETASILKHDKPTFEIADQSPKSYTNNYNFHHLAIQCLTFLCKSYSNWFNTEIIKKNWSSQYLSQCVIGAQYGFIENQWQERMRYDQLQLRAREIACDVSNDKAVKHAINFLLNENILTENAVAISAWLHQNRYDIPASNLGDFLGGSRPKEERPLEEAIRYEYIKQCDLNFFAPIEIVMQYFLTSSGFRLPGEAQKIERILESFAWIYYLERSEIWQNPDAVFVVFNAILMLNTSLHNPRIKEKDKLKKSVFLGMCLGVRGQNFAAADYARVYHFIEKNGYEISFEDEEKMAAERQFDEWRKKAIQNARRPLIAYTAELKKQIKTLNNLDRAKTVIHGSKSEYGSLLPKAQTYHSGGGGSDVVQHMHSLDFNAIDTDYYHTAGGPDPEDEDALMFEADEEDEEKQPSAAARQSSVTPGGRDDADDDALLDGEVDDEQREIETAMMAKFKAHSVANIQQDAAEYITFCGELLTKSWWWLRESAALRSTDLIYCPSSSSVELGCLLIDNWWPRILDALKIVFELNDDPYTTPLVLSILPHFLQITLTLGAFGHEPCKIAFNGILCRYKVWWLSAIQRMDEDTKSRNPNMAKHSDLRLIESKIWEQPQRYYEKLKTFILASQHIIHSRTIWLRLRDLQFEFADVHFMLRGREFIGEQTILKMGARDTTYRLFFFSDMLLYANGRPGKYRSHRVLLLIFCALEDLKDSRNVTNAFRIHSPQKSITIALPNAEYKRICFKKINELILKQRKKVRQLIQELIRKHDDKYLKLAHKCQRSSAFLHQNINYITHNKNPMPNHCKLCLSAFNRMGRRKKECPICDGNVCPKCIQRKAKTNTKTNKRRNVCDGCLDIVEGRLKL